MNWPGADISKLLSYSGSPQAFRQTRFHSAYLGHALGLAGNSTEARAGALLTLVPPAVAILVLTAPLGFAAGAFAMWACTSIVALFPERFGAPLD